MATAEHQLEAWEQTVESIMWLLPLPGSGVFTIVQVRRAIVDLRPDLYDSLTYCEQWTQALRHVMLETGMITMEELSRVFEDPVRDPS